jgi:hypothetical protein
MRFSLTLGEKIGPKLFILLTLDSKNNLKLKGKKVKVFFWVRQRGCW